MGRITYLSLGFIGLVGFQGCASSRTSNTARTATEQVLLSNAIDRSLSNIEFSQLMGQAVFVDDKYLDSVDKGYVMGSIRHRILSAGARLAADAKTADVVIEPRSGGVGTDTEESFVGTPAISIPGMTVQIPEIKLLSRNTQLGTAKLSLVAYDPKTGAAFGIGGNSTALTEHDDTYILGMGPIRRGDVRAEREKAVGYDTSVGRIASLGGKKPRRSSRPSVGLVDPDDTRMARLPQPRQW